MSLYTKINMLKSRREVIASLGALSLLPLIPLITSFKPAHADDSNSRVDLQWYDITASTIAAAKFPEPLTESRVWAVSWLAAARAINSLGYDNQDYAVAAFVTALHDTLVAQVPSQQPQLDAALASSLALVPSGAGMDSAIAAGQQSAAAVLAERNGDGMDTASIDTPFTYPAPAPGVWQPTPPSFGPAVRAGEGKARPFFLTSNSQFRPGPPPALNSDIYLNALSEIHAIGGATSTVRTADQTDAAKFWTDQSIHLFVPALRTVLADLNISLARSVRIVTAFHTISIDAQIAVYEAKYVYLFWRPVTAIQTGTVNPDPNWTSLVTTPRHPEYPSGHCGYAAAFVTVLTALVGLNPPQPISIQSPLTDPGSTRTFPTWASFLQENINARVWGGIHYRSSDLTGAAVGLAVASYALPRLRSIGL